MFLIFGCLKKGTPFGVIWYDTPQFGLILVDLIVAPRMEKPLNNTSKAKFSKKAKFAPARTIFHRLRVTRT